MPNTAMLLSRQSPNFFSPRNRISRHLADTPRASAPPHVRLMISTFHSHAINQPIKFVSLDREEARQMEIEALRARHKDEFDRIESIMPDLDDLISISINPPREWLDEKSP